MDSIEYAAPQTINGLNLYAYCGNNPVMGYDPEGTFVSTILGAIVGAFWGGINAMVNGQDIGAGIAIGAAVGALTGLAVDIGVATGGVGGLLIATGAALIIGAAGEVANQMVLENKSFDQLDWDVIAASGTMNAVSAVAGYGISYAAASAVGSAPEGNAIMKIIQSVLPKFTPRRLLGWTICIFICAWIFSFITCACKRNV